MQGLQSLNQFKDFVSSIGGLGRYEDTYIVHAAEGETVVPMEVLDQNPVLKKRLFKTMVEMGIEPGRYIVGNELNSKNPVTGQPEFFLKKIGRRLRKAAADISGYAAPIVGAMYGPAAGAAVGAALGQYKRENPGDPNQGMAMALRGGLSGVASNIASGQGALNPFGGAQGMYESANPLQLGKDIINKPMQFFKGKDGKTFKFMDKYFPGKEAQQTSRITKIMEEKERLSKIYPNAGDSLLDKLALESVGKSGIGPAGMTMKEVLGYGGLATGILGKLIEGGQPKGDNTPIPKPRTINDMIFPDDKSYDYTNYFAKGGVMDLQDGGESKGPGTGTSDSIPAMLSDGEFVMTAKAVRGAGGGDRREGARKMYEAMDRLEAKA
jgi:hypothetical protein